MAEIICTINDFHKYIGPRIRNVIQYMTKKRKKELNHLCQECKQNKELEAAHIKGNSRKDIIHKILEEFSMDKEKQSIKVDLDKFEKIIVESHKPVDKYFRFLCAQCHIKYDSKEKPKTILHLREIEISPTLTTSRPKFLIDNKSKKVFKILRDKK